MTKFKVKTPNPAFNGKRHGVQFRKGEAVAELDKHTVADFRAWGYMVEEIAEKKANEPTKKPRKQTKKTDK